MKGPGGNNMKTGLVCECDPEKVKCRVRFPDFDNLQSYWLPVGQKKSLKDKDYWLPDVGEHVICIMDDNAEFGVIICAIYSDKDTPPVTSQDKRHVRFEDGTWFEYDRKEHKLTGQVNGTVEITVTESATVTCPLVISDAALTRCTGNLMVEGNIICMANITAAGTIIDASGNTNHHTH